jgi:hypothetical protein
VVQIKPHSPSLLQLKALVGVITTDLGCSVLSERIVVVWLFSRMFANSLFDTGKDNDMPLILNP